MTHEKQNRADSFKEAVINTAIGFIISMIVWHFIASGFGIPMTWTTNIQIIGIFTIVSILRQYVLRRIFTGRLPWQTIKGVFI